jgi:hypothetical protein
MKLFIKISAAVLIILILLFGALYIFIAVKGRALLSQKLTEALKREVSIGNLSLNMPLELEIKDLSIAGLARAEYVYVSPGLSGLLSGKLTLNQVKVLKPEIEWEISPPLPAQAESDLLINREEALAQTREILNSPSLKSSKAKSSRPPTVIIGHLEVEQGVVELTDRAVSKQGIQIILKEIALTIDNLSFPPRSATTDFQLTARIPWKEDLPAGTIYASGWLNLYKKDMQARLEVEGIDGVYFHPYYSNWVDLENARIKEARLNFFSDIQGQSNEVVAQCRLELVDIKFRPRPPDEPEHKAEKITTAVLGIFRALNQGKIILNFTVKTKMDKPQFKFESINQAVDKTLKEAVGSGKVKLEDAALLPGRIVEGVAKGTSGATKAIVEGAISVGKSLLDVLTAPEEPEGTEEVQQD